MLARTMLLLFAAAFAIHASAVPSQPLAAADLDDVRQAGLITRTTADSITIADPHSGEALTFVVNAATRITRNGKPVLLRGVQPGEHARISARRINERRMAATISVTTR